MKYIDCHAHLNDDKLFNQIDEIVDLSKKNGCISIYNNGDSLESLDKILTISDKYPGFCHSVLGIHPEFALENDDYYKKSFEIIEKNINKISAIGEIGLDYHYSKEENVKKRQKELFISQIRLAKKYNLPIVVHSRDAGEDTLKIIKEEKPAKTYLHCYSDSKEIFNQYKKLGIEIYFGISGVVTFKNAKTIQDIVLSSSLDCFLSETDSPYLTPEPYRGKVNNSSNIPLIIKQISKLKNISDEETAKILLDNGERFYGKK